MSTDLARRLRGDLERLVAAGPPPADRPAVELDTVVYRDGRRHADELAVLRTHPLPVLAAASLDEPGAFVTIDVLGVEVIVLRDRDGTVRALRNSCAHRGAKVEHRAQGTARVWSCGFHGWSYELDGTLRAVTHPDLYSTESCTAGLRAVGAAERHGLVWVTIDEGGPPDVARWLGADLDDQFDQLGLASMVPFEQVDLDLDANWKLLTDGFVELYHLKYLHRASIAPYFPANVVGFDWFDGHLRTLLPKNRLLRMLAEQPDEADVLRGLTMSIVLVPGTVVQWQAGHLELFSLRPDPDHPNRTRCRLQMLVPAERAGDTDLWRRNWERLLATIPAEDFVAAEEVQRNIDAGSATTLRVGANERAIVEHLARLDELIAARRAAEPLNLTSV